MLGTLKNLSIEGYKSICQLKDFDLKPLNILIGANGAGKSNFIQLFRMLIAMAERNLTKFISLHGGADSFLYNGPKQTSKVKVKFNFIPSSPNAGPKDINSYRFELTPTVNEQFLVDEERKYTNTNWRSYGSPTNESRLYDMRDEKSYDGRWNGVGHFVYDAISKWMVYHFHDTSATAPMRRSEISEDCYKLRSDASNIAPFLLELKSDPDNITNYTEIINAVRLIIPFFDDFRLDTRKYGDEEKVRLSWQQKGSDFPMQPYHLSDGSIRFICLATALLQPNPPSCIIIDEPELGLHPEAIAVLAELIQDASSRTQIIVATQSPALINYFSVDDLIVVNRNDGQSTFNRLNANDFSEWLKDYSVGDLWTKNVIVGGPAHE